QADRDMQRALVAQRTLMFMKSDSLAAQEQMKSYTSSMLQITEHWKAYVAFPAHAGEAKLRAEFEAARAEWERSAGEVVKLLAQDSTDARKHAIDVSLNEGAEKFEKAHTVLRSLSDMHLSAAAGSVKTEEARAATIRWWMFIGIAAALAAALTVSRLPARSISRPLAETERASRRLTVNADARAAAIPMNIHQRMVAARASSVLTLLAAALRCMSLSDRRTVRAFPNFSAPSLSETSMACLRASVESWARSFTI